jgi:putative membrane protein
MRFVVKSAIAAVAIWFVTNLPFDLAVNGGENGEWWGRPLVFLLIGAVLVALNMSLKPLIKLLTLPVRILTLGLFGLIITWFILWLTSWITSREFFSVATLEVGGFWKTLFAAIVVTIVIAVLEGIIPAAKERDNRPRR